MNIDKLQLIDVCTDENCDSENNREELYRDRNFRLRLVYYPLRGYDNVRAERYSTVRGWHKIVTRRILIRNKAVSEENIDRLREMALKYVEKLTC